MTSINVKNSQNDNYLATTLLKSFKKTWNADEPRRHWEMMLHCENAMYPRPMPNLQLPSREARFYWHLYTATARHQPLYEKNLNLGLLRTLSKIVREEKMRTRILIPAELIKIRSLDYYARKCLIDQLERIIKRQNELETFCMEELDLKRTEGLRLISALYNSRLTLKTLYCWRAFQRTEDPLLIDSTCFQYLGLKYNWMKTLGYLEALTTLSLNYTYIATPTGDLLLELSKKFNTKWQWLQLLCIREEIPDGINRHTIPDAAWQKSRTYAPYLKVQLAIVQIPEHVNHKKFITVHMPVHTFALSTGLDLDSQRPWMNDCTIRDLWTWYPNCLVSLYLQLWHDRQILDTLLKKLFINLPQLQVFEFIGEIKSLQTLCAMCCQILMQRCMVKDVNFQIQQTIENKHDDKWKKGIEYLLLSFKDDFDRMHVQFNVSFYPL